MANMICLDCGEEFDTFETDCPECGSEDITEFELDEEE